MKSPCLSVSYVIASIAKQTIRLMQKISNSFHLISPCHCEHSEANCKIEAKDFKLPFINLTVCFTAFAMTGVQELTICSIFYFKLNKNAVLTLY